MKLDALLELEAHFQPLIEPDYFTVIAPVNDVTFEWFTELAYKHIAAHSMVELLSNKAEIHRLLATLNPEIHLSVYVISKRSSDILSRQRLGEYLKDHTTLAAI